MTKVTVIYDKECSLCQGSKNWIEKKALPGTVEFVPCQSSERIKRFPQVRRENCMTALQLIMPDERVLSGADAIPEILYFLKGWKWVAIALRLPLVKNMSPLVYQWIARHRHFISCVFFPTEKLN